MFDKLSKKLQQIDPYFVNDLMTKGVIRFFLTLSLLAGLKIVLLLCCDVFSSCGF